ncbi:lipase 3-like [Vanessa cardui]|uniref:lipase 3-like n=1 Tax=Vanessa cardui TaxID=171605 RepID=UPI001F13D107|nr:lipase 3-like [Vanessa cardui]
MLGILPLVTILVCGAQALPGSVEKALPYGQVADRYFDVEERLLRDGYYSESHTVTTSDGYMLEINRIPFRRHETADNATKTSKPVVFLMHGLQGSAISYVSLGPDRALAYILADEGYDVWLGNARGVLNSRRHVTLDPDVDVEEFFDITYEDIGMKDLPAIIDYILELTGKSKLHYVGHSQGGTAFLVLNSMLPEYNQKIESANLLAGVGYQEHFPNRILSLLAISTNPIYSYALRQGIIEILGPDWNSFLNEAECNDTNVEACGLLIIKEIMGDLFDALETLAGASIKQYAHYGQNIRAKSFRRWYYSPIMNLIKYGSLNPPEYQISAITAEVTMHYTVNDSLLDEQDVIDMAKVMQNASTRKVARETYTHTDFVVAPDSRELVYDYIVESLSRYER